MRSLILLNRLDRLGACSSGGPVASAGRPGVAACAAGRGAGTATDGVRGGGIGCVGEASALPFCANVPRAHLAEDFLSSEGGEAHGSDAGGCFEGVADAMRASLAGGKLSSSTAMKCCFLQVVLAAGAEPVGVAAGELMAPPAATAADEAGRADAAAGVAFCAEVTGMGEPTWLPCAGFVFRSAETAPAAEPATRVPSRVVATAGEPRAKTAAPAAPGVEAAA